MKKKNRIVFYGTESLFSLVPKIWELIMKAFIILKFFYHALSWMNYL